MARRRYISTCTSVDKDVNKLGTKYGDFAALLYILMIPHAEDDGTLTGDPEELLATVLPMRRDKTEADVAEALEGMAALQLIEWDTERGIVAFPADSFYRYQTYIPPAKRRGYAGDAPQDSAEEKQSAQISEQQRETPQNAAYPSPSLSPSPSPSVIDSTYTVDPTLTEGVQGDSGGASPPTNEAAKPKRTTTNGTRGTRLPEEWQPTKEAVEAMRSEVPGFDLRASTERFRDYFRGAPGVKGVKCDWLATWRNWVREDHRRAAVPSRAAPASASPGRKLTPTEERLKGSEMRGRHFIEDVKLGRAGSPEDTLIRYHLDHNLDPERDETPENAEWNERCAQQRQWRREREQGIPAAPTSEPLKNVTPQRKEITGHACRPV